MTRPGRLLLVTNCRTRPIGDARGVSSRKAGNGGIRSSERASPDRRIGHSGHSAMLCDASAGLSFAAIGELATTTGFVLPMSEHFSVLCLKQNIPEQIFISKSPQTMRSPKGHSSWK